jgi:hypothetical protein
MFELLKEKMIWLRRGRWLSVKSEFDLVFEQFLAQAFGHNELPDFVPPKIQWRKFDQVAEQKLYRTSENWLRRVRELNYDSAGFFDDTWLAEEIKVKQREFDAVGHRAFISAHFAFSRQIADLESASKDCVYVKLNHGFWEDLYGLFAAASEQKRRRPRDLDFSRESTVGSGFLLALECLTREFGRLTSTGIKFSEINYALNLTDGMIPNDELLENFDTISPLMQEVCSSAAVGAASYFQKLFGKARVNVQDGCFPKRGFLDGELREVMTSQAAMSDRIVFVVPPHLRSIRLEVSPSPKQEVIHVSRELAQESWVASLYTTAAHIMGRMQAGQSVLVIAQCGPFAVLLGLFLARAAKELACNGARLRYFDLGQVTDIANPPKSGPWIKNYGLGTDKLFVVDGKS